MLTDSEKQRHNEQARVADIVAQTLQLRLQGGVALSVIGTFLTVIIVAIAIAQAEKVVKPINELALKNRVLIEGALEDIRESKSDRKEILKLVRELAQKK